MSIFWQQFVPVAALLLSSKATNADPPNLIPSAHANIGLDSHQICLNPPYEKTPHDNRIRCENYIKSGMGLAFSAYSNALAAVRINRIRKDLVKRENDEFENALLSATIGVVLPIATNGMLRLLNRSLPLRSSDTVYEIAYKTLAFSETTKARLAGAIITQFAATATPRISEAQSAAIRTSTNVDTEFVLAQRLISAFEGKIIELSKALPKLSDDQLSILYKIYLFDRDNIGFEFYMGEINRLYQQFDDVTKIGERYEDCESPPRDCTDYFDPLGAVITWCSCQRYKINLANYRIYYENNHKKSMLAIYKYEGKKGDLGPGVYLYDIEPVLQELAIRNTHKFNITMPALP